MKWNRLYCSLALPHPGRTHDEHLDVAPEEIHTRQVDVFAPAALGAVLRATT
jgi:glutamate dehydrogenase/leucine dehydrogenase